MQSLEDRFWSKVDKTEPHKCWNWLGATTKAGYGGFGLNGKTVRAHRLAWELTKGHKVPEGKFILHHCDNPSCCNPAHLYCGTGSDNAIDRLIRNPVPPEVLGSGKAKLYDGEIWLIRRLLNSHEFTQHYIAKMFKVNRMTISHISTSKSTLCREGYYA